MNPHEIAARLREAADEADALATELREDARKARELAAEVLGTTPPPATEIARRGRDLFTRSMGHAHSLDLARRPPPQVQEGQPLTDPRSPSTLELVRPRARAKILKPPPRP